MTSKQKIKGSTWEREVANDLSMRYNEKFIRTIGSGAYIGGKNNSRIDELTEEQVRHHKSDITPPDSFNLMNMECKSYKDFTFHKLITNNCTILDNWIEQVEEASSPLDLNIIAIKIDRKGKYICVEHFEDLEVENAIKYKHYYFFEYHQFFIDNYFQFKDRCAKDYKRILIRREI